MEEEWREDGRWLGDTRRVNDSESDNVGDLPVLDRVREQHFSFPSLHSKQVCGRDMLWKGRKTGRGASQELERGVERLDGGKDEREKTMDCQRGGGRAGTANEQRSYSFFPALSQGLVPRTTSDESSATEGESALSSAELERERAMERERKRVSILRETARANHDYHSQFNSEHLHWDPL